MIDMITLTDSLEQKSNQALLNILANLGGWYLNHDPNPVETIHLAREIIRLKELGFSYSFLMSIYVGPDLKNTSRNLIAVSD